ncbi:MAG TPA: hypothetical protein VJV78_29710 [Polyangiales bacterium]|nr:hypothetical protein [Polyangiales bacterium]
MVIALWGASCSEDLPHQGPVPDGETGMQEGEQKEAEGDMTSGASADGVRTGMGGSPSPGGATKSGSGGASGQNGMMSSGSAGDSAMSSSSGGMGGKGTAGTGGSMMNAAGATSSMPAVKVVAACMARAGEMVCDGAKMIKCGEKFDAAETMVCQNEARCFAGLAAGTCGKCDPGVTMCMEKDLMECSMSGEMVVKETCASAALCDQVGKRCEPAMCEADEHDCEGGSLRKCQEDLTGWDVVTSCPPELCDAEGKKCNKCLPGMVMCKDDSTLTTCAEDGSMETDKACPMATPICSMDKCVQCLTDDTCKPMSDCQKSSCMNGMCTPVQNLPLESPCSSNGGKVCSVAGTCVACNSDLSCSPSQRCSVVFGCIERQALTVTSLIPGTYTVQVNAGWGLEIADHKMGALVSVTAIGLSTNGANTGRILMGSEATQRVVTFRGPSGVGASEIFPTLGTTCYANPFTDTSATLNFTEGKKRLNPQDETGPEVPDGVCGMQVSVSIRAVQ